MILPHNQFQKLQLFHLHFRLNHQSSAETATRKLPFSDEKLMIPFSRSKIITMGGLCGKLQAKAHDGKEKAKEKVGSGDNNKHSVQTPPGTTGILYPCGPLSS